MEMESRSQQRELQKAVTDQPNLTGIPTQMKLNFEQRSGMSFDDVRVHYNSDKPAQFHALAYTQGTQIYVGPGQERSLPHELGHVIQQKAGLVRANAMHPSGVAMNTEEALERQADEIGAGGRIEMSPANNASTNIVQRYIKVNNCIFAQAPGPNGKRKVMVKDGEPASVYFEQSVSEPIAPLWRLGIVKTKEGEVYKDSGGGDIGTFFRYGQGQIPDISSAYGQKNVGAPIPQPTRTYDKFQKAGQLLGLQIDITVALWSLANDLWRDSTSKSINQRFTDIMNKTTEIVKAYHEYKKPDHFIAMHLLGRDITLDILALQSIAGQLNASTVVDLDPIEAQYNQLKEQNTNKPSDVEQKQDELLAENTAITSQNEVSFALQIAEEFLRKMKNWQYIGGATAIVECIDHFKKQGKPETSSIIQLINHFCDSVKGRIDLILALEMVKEDLEFRLKQLKEEYMPEVRKFVPQIPTGCDESAKRRETLSSLKFDIAYFPNNNFGQALKNESFNPWSYHCATPVPLSELIGENDCLFIEDAVGKTSSGLESANAHWVARIYGQREEQNSIPQAGAVETDHEAVDGFKKLDCRFNNLSQELRCKFLNDFKINNDSVFVLTYFTGLSAIMLDTEKPKGVLKIVVRNNLIMYDFSVIPSTPYMRHFLMDVAKTVLDKFVLQAFVPGDKNIQEELDSINIRLVDLAPDATDFSIERLHLRKK